LSTVTTQGKSLNDSKIYQQEMSLILHNVTGLIIVQENVADYTQDNLIKIYHDVSSQAV
jgi:hypothetical protein